jgi:hypothetical protein
MRRQRASTQPSDSSVSQRAPLRITLMESARYTWCAWKLLHTRTMRRTARSNWSAPQASAAALMAPAEVPVTMGNGLGSLPAPQARRRSAMASSTPT